MFVFWTLLMRKSGKCQKEKEKEKIYIKEKELTDKHTVQILYMSVSTIGASWILEAYVAGWSKEKIPFTH